MNRASPFVLSDDSRPGSERQILYAEPVRIVTARAPSEVQTALSEIDRGLRGGLHAAGYFSYELGYHLEPRLAAIAPPPSVAPLLWFGLFAAPRVLAPAEFSQWLETNISGRAYAGALHYTETPESYAKKFATVEDYIADGDVYQINLTFRGRFRFLGDPLALYARLRGHAEAGQGAYLFDGERDILSFSPELFFAIADDCVTARPMKGTAPRGADAAGDSLLKANLGRSAKDRAENLMIVDLIRNDFGRLAKTGTVRTSDLFAVETYPTVHQMVSTVRAELRPGLGVAELIGAIFPCGSVTGAPKIRAMEIIRALEPEPRGIYCGSIGAFAPDGSGSFNVAIRTLTIEGEEGSLGVGSAVVADSNAPGEYAECLLKARYFELGRVPIKLIETLRFEPAAGLIRGEHHLARMRRAAGALGIAFDEAAIRAAMDRAIADAAPAPAQSLRLRLLLSEDGTIAADARPLAAADEKTVWRYVISPTRIPSADRLARHKTSWREHYDAERARWNALGADEVLYLNERDELAEGSVSNVFVLLGGRMVTPPLSAGALDGCLRRTLLEAGTCAEAALNLAALARAEAVYFGNSLRGLIRGEALKPLDGAADGNSP